MNGTSKQSPIEIAEASPDVKMSLGKSILSLSDEVLDR
jgi:hypothetical protein